MPYTPVNVEWYISNKAERIKIATDHEAIQHKLDAVRFNQLVIQEVRERSDSYNDDYGTGGFFKWLSNIILMTRRGYDHINHKTVKLPEAVKPLVEVEKPIIERVAIASPTKKCIACSFQMDKDIFHPLEAFYKNSNMDQGRDSSCKEQRRKAINEKNQTIRKSKMPQMNNTPSIPRPSPIKPEPTVQFNDVAFSNEEITELIAQIKAKQDAIQNQMAELHGKTIMYDQLIQKLQRRLK